MTSKDLPLPANVPSPVDVSSSKDLPSPANVPSPIDVSSSTDIPSLTYSTLEFNQNTIKTYLPTQGLIPVTSEDDPLPQAVQSNPLDNPNSENDTTFIHGGEAPRKFGGISIKKWGIMIVGVVLVVLGAVLGGIFGTHNNRHHNTEMTHGTETTSVEISTTTITTISPSSTLDLNILPNSNITATSLFDREKPGDTAYRFVVFQDVTSALIFRAWNSTAKVWVTKNLTQITQNSAPINVMTGTPLTSVALLGSHSWWVKVWCLHPDGGILAITLNMFSVFENSNEHLLYYIKLNTVPMDGSDRNSRTSLAASVHSIIDVPGEESDFAYLVYQYKSGIVCVSQWNSEDKLPDIATFILEGASVSHQSHLYLASLSQRLKSENSSTLSLSYESNGSWFEVYVNFTSYPGFYQNSDDFRIDSLSYNEYDIRGKIKQLIIMPFMRDNSTLVELYLVLLSNGTLLGKRFQNGDLRPMKVSGRPDTNFTSIATTDDCRLYGIAGDQILEYAFNFELDNSEDFTHVDRVYP